MFGGSIAVVVVCSDLLADHVHFPVMLQFGSILGGFGIFVPVLFFGLGAPYLSPGLNTILAAAELPVGLFVAMMVLAEPMTAAQWIGVVAILVGIGISQI